MAPAMVGISRRGMASFALVALAAVSTGTVLPVAALAGDGVRSVLSGARRVTTTSVVIPWGEGAGRLGKRVSGDDDAPRGPSSFRLGPGDEIFILDDASSEIECFSPTGAHLRSFPLPSIDGEGAPCSYSDLFVTAEGSVFALERSHGVIVEARTGKEPPRPVVVPGLARYNLPVSLAVSPNGQFLVFEGLSATVLRISPDGKLLDRFRNSSCRDLVTDASGFLAIVESGGPRLFRLSLVNPVARKRRKLRLFKLAHQLESLAVRGVDGRRRIFLERVRIDRDERESHRVVIFSGDGVKLGSFGIDPPPRLLPLTRSRSVGVDGTFAWLCSTEEGLVVKTRKIPPETGTAGK